MSLLRYAQPYYRIRQLLNEGIYESVPTINNTVFQNSPMVNQVFARGEVYGGDTLVSGRPVTDFWPDTGHGFCRIAQLGGINNDLDNYYLDYVESEREVVLPVSMTAPIGDIDSSFVLNKPPTEFRPEFLVAQISLLTTDWTPYWTQAQFEAGSPYFAVPGLIPPANDPTTGLPWSGNPIINWNNQPPFLDSDPTITIRVGTPGATVCYNCAGTNAYQMFLRFKLDGRRYYGFGVKILDSSASYQSRTSSPPPPAQPETTYLSDAAVVDLTLSGMYVLR